VITVACPACSKKFRVPDVRAGKRTRCPTCRTILTAPQDPEDLAYRLLQEAEEASTIPTPCPGCRRFVPIPVELGGQRTRCPTCNARIHVPLDLPPPPCESKACAPESSLETRTHVLSTPTKEAGTGVRCPRCGHRKAHAPPTAATVLCPDCGWNIRVRPSSSSRRRHLPVPLLVTSGIGAAVIALLVWALFPTERASPPTSTEAPSDAIGGYTGPGGGNEKKPGHDHTKAVQDLVDLVEHVREAKKHQAQSKPPAAGPSRPAPGRTGPFRR
jgi:DNA-directed RNA polymerase subunit RPC12/RpoP